MAAAARALAVRVSMKIEALDFRKVFRRGLKREAQSLQIGGERGVFCGIGGNQREHGIGQAAALAVDSAASAGSKPGTALRAFRDQCDGLPRNGFRSGLVRIKKPHFGALARQPTVELLFARMKSGIGRQIIQQAGRCRSCGQSATGKFRSSFPGRG